MGIILYNSNIFSFLFFLIERRYNTISNTIKNLIQNGGGGYKWTEQSWGERSLILLFIYVQLFKFLGFMYLKF
jgi:hypothetical protein